MRSWLSCSHRPLLQRPKVLVRLYSWERTENTVRRGAKKQSTHRRARFTHLFLAGRKSLQTSSMTTPPLERTFHTQYFPAMFITFKCPPEIHDYSDTSISTPGQVLEALWRMNSSRHHHIYSKIGTEAASGLCTVKASTSNHPFFSNPGGAQILSITAPGARGTNVTSV